MNTLPWCGWENKGLDSYVYNRLSTISCAGNRGATRHRPQTDEQGRGQGCQLGDKCAPSQSVALSQVLSTGSHVTAAWAAHTVPTHAPAQGVSSDPRESPSGTAEMLHAAPSRRPAWVCQPFAATPCSRSTRVLGRLEQNISRKAADRSLNRTVIML